MKFGEQLESQKIPEWRQQYIDYNKVKQIIEKIENAVEFQQQQSEQIDMEKFQETLNSYDETFYQKLKAEIEKMEQFYEQTLEQYDVRLSDLTLLTS